MSAHTDRLRQGSLRTLGLLQAAVAAQAAQRDQVECRSRWPRTAFRNAAVCAAVHTATAGRIPVSSHAAIRSDVHTGARGRRAGGS